MQGPIRRIPRLSTAILTVLALGALALPAASATSAHTSTTTASRASTSGVLETATASSARGTLTSTVRGTFGSAGKVRGHFEPVRFIVRNGQGYAYGVLHAKLVRGNGHVVGHATKRITIPIASGSTARAAATPCSILNLVLGPLDLNLLGLHVHLNRVVLHIEAIPGAGNLLGNLLCAIAGLLDQTGLLSTFELTNALNRVLNALGIV